MTSLKLETLLHDILETIELAIVEANQIDKPDLVKDLNNLFLDAKDLYLENKTRRKFWYNNIGLSRREIAIKNKKG